MVVKVVGLEAKMENLARSRRVVVHRSPARDPRSSQSGYFVCDYNNVILFPQPCAPKPWAATAEEAHQWLVANRRAEFLSPC